jgi:hypothetical protein
MDQQSCITDTLWLGYSNKTLSQPEIDMIHHHAETCEICADMKEGIDAMRQSEMLENTVATIYKKVDDYLEPKRKLGILWYWSAAAILIFGIGLSWFWVNTTEPIVKIGTDSLITAKQTEEKSEIKNEPNIDSSEAELKEIPLAINMASPIKQVPNYENKDRRDDAKMQVEEDMGNGSMDDLDKITETKKLPDTTHYVITPPVDTVPRGVTLAFENLATSGSYSNTAPASMESYSSDNVMIKKSENYTFTEAEESKSANRKKVNTSSRKTTSLPAPMSNSNTNGAANNYALSKYLNLNDSANFALAKANFTQNNFTQCLESLKNITSNPASLYYEEGLLLKAKALIKQKKNKEAKLVLRITIALNGIRKSEAEEILKELK